MSLKLLTALIILLIGSGSASGQGNNPDLIAQAKKEGWVTWYTTDIENESMNESIKLFQQTFGLTPG